MDIEIDYLIGEFHRPKVNDKQYVYACRRVGGVMIHCGEETKALKYISPFALPMLMVPNRKKQIACYRKGDIRIKQTLQDHGFGITLKKLIKN